MHKLIRGVVCVGMRPFGVSFLFAGYDKHFGFQLYQSDPSGNYGGWKAIAIGANNSSAQSILKQDYKDDMDLEAALLLAIKVLGKTMDSTQLTPDKRELSSHSLPVSILPACALQMRKFLRLG